MDGSTLYLPPTEDSESPGFPEQDGQQHHVHQYSPLSSPQPHQPPHQQHNPWTDRESQQSTSDGPAVDVNQEIKLIPPKSEVSFVSAIAVAVLIFCVCGCLFGLIAFVIAMIGRRRASNEDTGSAHRMLRASYAFSIAGFITGIAVVTIIIFLAPPVPDRCGSTGDCNFGSYLDSVGCPQCCSSPGFCSYGSYTNSYGCRHCCELHSPC